MNRKPIKIIWTKEKDNLKRLIEVEGKTLDEVSEIYDMPKNQVRVAYI